MNILIADDHAILRSGLRQILADATQFQHIGETGTGIQTLRKLEEGCWDVVLLDLTLPEMNGLEVLKEIKRRWPDVAVLVLSMHGEDQYAIRALKAGAAGYLTKGCKAEELLQALGVVSRGEKYITLS
ncbi:MAG: response regulator transcription factor, partial [Gammaproteobacteria bacterium]